MAKILVVEDDRILSSILIQLLQFEHHQVEHTSSGSDAISLLMGFGYDLVVLDWELPDCPGIEVLRRFRDGGGQAAVLFLTGRDSVEDKEAGLDRGADDYLTKPFNNRELLARVRALLRRKFDVQDNILRFADIELDPQKFRATRAGQDLGLVRREFTLLEFFMRHPGQVFSADALLSRVWRADEEVAPAAVRSCLRRLREKLALDGDDEKSYIINLRGSGYKLGLPDEHL